MNVMHLCETRHHVIQAYQYYYYYFTSNDDIQPSTLITDQSPSGLLLDIK